MKPQGALRREIDSWRSAGASWLAEEAEKRNPPLRRSKISNSQQASSGLTEVEGRAQEDARPCLVINRIPQFIQQVTNDQRQNRPSIKVHPVDDQADVETAKVIQGLIRHIEYNSNADVPPTTRRLTQPCAGALASSGLLTDYVSETSFDQEILIKRIRNPFSVYLDPQEPDGSDASYAFVVEEHSKDDYKARFPNSKLALDGDWSSVGNTAPGWMTDGGCRVAEYFYKDTASKEIVLLSNGQVVMAEQIPAEGLPEGIKEMQRRTTRVPVIRWCKMNALEILQQTEWPGIYIPIVPVYGTELYVNGKRILEGIVRNAKDPQRMLNYWTSAETEAIALAPRAPFIAAEGQLEGYEGMWESANRKNHAYLPYKPTAINGSPVPPPQRMAFEPAVQAITQARMLAADDLKATTGIYDAALGSRSNETSGVAIQRRNMQAQTSNFHFVDNLTRSLRHTGRILIDLIPKIYDTARTARIIGDDGTQRIVKLNEEFDENGKPVTYSLGAGKYDTTVDVGPSFASKRQEAAASMIDITKAYPQIAQVAGDLIVKNMDWPGAQEIAERLKKTLPPGLADDPKSQNAPIPPQVKAQMQQMGQMIEKMTSDLHALHDERDRKLIELESRERIEFKKLEVQLEIERARIDAKDSIEILSHEINQIHARMSMLREGQPISGLDDHFAQQDPGAPGAHGMPQGPTPTGGESPGSPMEGMQPHVDSSQNV
jgi:hypothetical protein